MATNVELKTADKVEGNIRTELIHRARLAVDLEAKGQRVDIGDRAGDVIVVDLGLRGSGPPNWLWAGLGFSRRRA